MCVHDHCVLKSAYVKRLRSALLLSLATGKPAPVDSVRFDRRLLWLKYCGHAALSAGELILSILQQQRQ